MNKPINNCEPIEEAERRIFADVPQEEWDALDAQTPRYSLEQIKQTLKEACEQTLIDYGPTGEEWDMSVKSIAHRVRVKALDIFADAHADQGGRR